MTDWKTRLAKPEDIAPLQKLIASSARGLNNEHYSAAEVESILKYVYGVDSQLIHDETYFAVEDGERLIACGGWSRRKTLYGGDQLKADNPDNLLNPATDAARIRAFFVHPDYARQGLGSLLMETCEAAAREAGFQRMELMATLTGEYLYQRFGFEAEESQAITLPDGNIMQVRRMSKTISPA